MTSSVSELIRNRRTIHQFKANELPSRKLVEQAISHAVWAPNHHLSQPWHFRLIGPDTAGQICQLNAEIVREKKGKKAAAIKLKRWREIPGWLLLSCEKSENELRRQEDYAACCCAAQNLALLLWEHGVGMKWTTGEITRDPRFYDIVQLDRQKQSVIGLFWYGYPVEIPLATRQPADTFFSVLP